MAYYLDESASSGSNGYVTFPDYSIANNADFSLSFKLKIIGSTGFKRIIGRLADTNSDININALNQIIVQNAAGSSITLTLDSNLVVGTLYEFTVSRVSNTVTVEVDSQSKSGTLGGSFLFNSFFRQGTFTSGGEFGLAWFDFGDRRYENTSGTGSTLPDIVDSQDGTLVNFPTDDSQWVFYDDGGEVDVTPTAATSTSTSHNPAVAAGAAVSPTAATSESTGLDPAVATGAIATPTTATSTSAAIDPVVASGKVVNPTSAASESTAHDPTIASGALVSPTAAQSESDALDPTVTAAQAGSASPTVAESVSQSPDPVVVSGAAVAPTAAQSESTAHDPVVGVVVQINPTVATSVSQAFDPVISTGVSVVVDVAQSESAANDPIIGTAAAITPTTALSESVGLDPVVSAGVVAFIRKARITGLYARRATLSGKYIRRVRL